MVYEALQVPLRRPVVVKVLRPNRGDTAERRARFEREAHTLASLNHPHIVSVHDFGVDGDLMFIVMEALVGRSLRELKQHGKPAEPEWVAARVYEIALALQAAHAQGVAHRDLKPANVFVVNNGVLKDYVQVLDFGLARAIENTTDEESITESGFLVGTPGYLSPEQIEGEEADFRSDLYALGVMWYEMLTGVNPFRAETKLKTLMRQVEHRPQAPSEWVPNAGISPQTDAAVLRLLEKSPALRFQSAEDLLAEMGAPHRTQNDDSITNSTSHLVRPQLPKPSRETGAPPPARPSNALRVGLTIAVLSAAAFAFFTSSSAAALRIDEPREISIDAIVPIEPVEGLHKPLVDLGRALYDAPELSGSQTVACQTCHPMSAGGTTPEPFTSLGESKAPLPWNTPSVLNACFSFRQLWTAQVENLGDVVDRPLFNPALMNAKDWPSIVGRIQKTPHLVQAFQNADRSVSADSMREAFAAYLCSIVPTNARFDLALRGRGKLTAPEERGYRRFVEYGCVSCHQGQNVGGNMTARFGVGVESPFADRGRCADGSYCWNDTDCGDGGVCAPDTTGPRPQDLGIGGTADNPTYVFRVPSLRNVDLTAPYFHDGSAKTLRSAIAVMGKNQLGRDLGPEAIDDLASFLKTLTGEAPPR